MKVLKYLFIIILPLNLYSDSINELFKEANEKYKEGKYEEAIQKYETIISKGIKNGYLFYNLGNAYFKIKKIGKAILNYEKANLYIPNDKDVSFNLKFANSFKTDIIEEKYSPFTKIILFVYNLFPLNTLFYIVYLFLWIIIASFIIKWFVKNILIRTFAYKLFPYILTIFLMLSSLFFIKIYQSHKSRYGIIITEKSEIRSGPGEDYTIIFTLHEGTKLRLYNQSGNFIQVSLPNGYTGWIKSEEVEQIE